MHSAAAIGKLSGKKPLKSALCDVMGTDEYRQGVTAVTAH